MNARQQYRAAWFLVRIYGNPLATIRSASLDGVRTIPVDIRRAAARSFNARRYAKTVYYEGQETRRRHDPRWLPF